MARAVGISKSADFPVLGRLGQISLFPEFVPKVRRCPEAISSLAVFETRAQLGSPELIGWLARLLAALRKS